MITISAMKWAPPFAAGQVRDVRLRWVLNEVGWAYTVRLVDAPTMASAEYRAKQPFGQVPYLEEDGRPALFETAAIVLDVATRAARLLPEDAGERALAASWALAAVGSIEPFLMNLAEVDYFTEDAEVKARRRPIAVAAADRRLEQLAAALGERRWLVADAFSVADLMMASILEIARRLALLAANPSLVAYHARCFARDACVRAIADQCATITAHDMTDMRYEPDAA